GRRDAPAPLASGLARPGGPGADRHPGGPGPRGKAGRDRARVRADTLGPGVPPAPAPEEREGATAMNARVLLPACALCLAAFLRRRRAGRAGGGAPPAPRAPLAAAPGAPPPRGAVARLGPLRWRITSSAWSLSFSPDGKRLVSSDRHGVRLWDVASGK